MQPVSISVSKAVNYLNNQESSERFVLPAIQRSFIWSEGQICRLFDSILREYPIGTLLIWKTKNEIRCREFIKYYVDSTQVKFSSADKSTKHLVLDGQQRLQSLLIGLRGSYNGKELFFNVLSGEISHPDEMKYEFAFMEKEIALANHNSDEIWIAPKEIIDAPYSGDAREEIRNRVDRELNEVELKKN